MTYSLQTYVKGVGNWMNSNLLEQNHKKKAQNLHTEIGSSYIKSFGFICNREASKLHMLLLSNNILGLIHKHIRRIHGSVQSKLWLFLDLTVSLSNRL